MTAIIETTVEKKPDGWQIARITVSRNGRSAVMEMRCKDGQKPVYVARSGPHSLIHRGTAALENWLVLRSLSDAPGYQAFVTRWFRRAAGSQHFWRCGNCDTLNGGDEMTCRDCGAPRAW